MAKQLIPFNLTMRLCVGQCDSLPAGGCREGFIREAHRKKPLPATTQVIAPIPREGIFHTSSIICILHRS